MKKILSILAIAVLLLIMACNKNKSCNYAMEYNSDTKQCECSNLITPENRPELVYDDYNDCVTLGRHFYYEVKKIEDHPYLSEDGDTVMLKGYVYRFCGQQLYYPIDNQDSTYVGFTMCDDSTSAMATKHGQFNNFWIETEPDMINGLDLTRMFYVKGVVRLYNYESHTYHIEDYPPEPTPCFAPKCFIIPQEIHN